MEAKDIEKLLAQARLLDPNLSADRERYIAEISFKAGRDEGRENPRNPVISNATRKELKQSWIDGRKSGMREVVEWVDDNVALIEKYDVDMFICIKDWQAFKKERGL